MDSGWCFRCFGLLYYRRLLLLPSFIEKLFKSKRGRAVSAAAALESADGYEAIERESLCG
jgi:hypothetical protein